MLGNFDIDDSNRVYNCLFFNVVLLLFGGLFSSFFYCCFSFGLVGFNFLFGSLGNLELNLLDPLQELSWVNFFNLGVESIEVPEAFVDQIENFRVESELLGVVSDHR